MATIKPLVIFDFDGTLTRDDTFISFARHALSPVRIARAVISSLPSLIRWKAGSISSTQAKETLYRHLYHNLSRSTIEHRATTFQPRYNPVVLEILGRHREAGDDVWIISASLDLWLNTIARHLGVNLICTGTETDCHGNLTGHFSTPNCRGNEKVRRLALSVPDYASRPITLYANELTPSGGDSPLAAIAAEVIKV